MTQPSNLEAIMGLIMYGGEAKGKAVEAIHAARDGQFEKAQHLLQEATHSLNVAHRSQTNLLSQEAAGDQVDLSLLLVHGQDHMMTALAFIDLAKELVAVYDKISKIQRGEL
ncbi:lactose/cellobiose-specific phosphotransferase system (PTS), IIA component [Streptococcus equi subsp. zooepidemicus Sz16]|uniref:PTS lactose/cellobiose transporter subunit IIA n=1 Tax=Streptococcus equi TaxID=1336 RepID=UPI0005B8D20C|nr:PTS lactose/cellobiose transporter subunit IIA [Streptococcus equi]KIS06848.1 lactose/cellobiose-specific phosphotransferase system (PTS), IIA component [Streptococcus equi subsp. zooepidemicus Sz16]KIS17446.1 lactose/cellobiose-specific phosphotransferase system (PTS), IIA component [Streptococcus equi subsp. zooepidemicus SzAM35]MCD3394272.1 PTS lactose/cellobiose transporter subunit IIA [Streptococcus equi subsp. zooepidemicus]MDI5945676.1 PTS lactose/cellobiose transporter subunit IIA [S